MARPIKTSHSPPRNRAPAATLEEREEQLVYLAVELAAKQMMEGTASSQVITHYLKLGSTKERLEKEKLAQENHLLKVKADSLQSSKNVEKLYKDALDAMRSYSGRGADADDD